MSDSVVNQQLTTAATPDCPYTMHGAEVPCMSGKLLRQRNVFFGNCALAWRSAALLLRRRCEALRAEVARLQAELVQERESAARIREAFSGCAEQVQRHTDMAVASAEKSEEFLRRAREAEAEVARLTERLNEQDGRLHAIQEVCTEVGIEPTAQGLRSALVRILIRVIRKGCEQ